MRSAALLLTLAFAGLQTVAFADCCCVDECARKAKQETSCGNCDGSQSSSKQDHAAPAKEQDSTNCLHVQPSPDVVSHAQDGVVIPESAIVALLEPIAATPTWTSVGSEEDSPRKARGRPLFILHSSLLI